MTTTDPTPLAEQIAREHQVRPFTHLASGFLACSCSMWRTFTLDTLPAHIATVTERAVRERIEDEAMLREIYRAALRKLGTDPDAIDAAFREGLNTPPEELGASVSPVYITNGAPDA